MVFCGDQWGDYKWPVFVTLCHQIKQHVTVVRQLKRHTFCVDMSTIRVTSHSYLHTFYVLLPILERFCVDMSTIRVTSHSYLHTFTYTSILERFCVDMSTIRVTSHSYLHTFTYTSYSWAVLCWYEHNTCDVTFVFAYDYVYFYSWAVLCWYEHNTCDVTFVFAYVYVYFLFLSGSVLIWAQYVWRHIRICIRLRILPILERFCVDMSTIRGDVTFVFAYVYVYFLFLSGSVLIWAQYVWRHIRICIRLRILPILERFCVDMSTIRVTSHSYLHTFTYTSYSWAVLCWYEHNTCDVTFVFAYDYVYFLFLSGSVLIWAQYVWRHIPYLHTFTYTSYSWAVQCWYEHNTCDVTFVFAYVYVYFLFLSGSVLIWTQYVWRHIRICIRLRILPILERFCVDMSTIRVDVTFVFAYVYVYFLFLSGSVFLADANLVRPKSKNTTFIFDSDLRYHLITWWKWIFPVTRTLRIEKFNGCPGNHIRRALDHWWSEPRVPTARLSRWGAERDCRLRSGEQDPYSWRTYAAPGMRII